MNQREANKAALRFAVELIRMQDLDSLFPDEYGESDGQDEILQKAQDYAASRIERLLGDKK